MSFDIWLFNAINHLPHGAFTDGLALILSQLGNWNTATGIALVFFAIGVFGANKKLWQHSLAVFAGIVLGYLIIDLLKMVFGRPRPYEVLSDVYLVGEAAGASFPSWHAAFYAFFAGYILMRVSERAKAWWFMLAFLGGFARIYQGFHYPSDIVAGWVLGALFAWLIAFLFSSFNLLRYNDSTS